MLPPTTDHVALAQRVVRSHLLGGRDFAELRPWDQAALACVAAAATETIFAAVSTDCEDAARLHVLEILGGATHRFYPRVRQRALELVRECLSAIAFLARKSALGERITDEDVTAALLSAAATKRALWGDRKP